MALIKLDIKIIEQCQIQLKNLNKYQIIQVFLIMKKKNINVVIKLLKMKKN